ncbi:ADP-ribosyl cyclase/cyclic ADP-ribose hydrolase 1-like [Centroberyx affinis]|uniref:ADP-ribosyl cyclase/cyclic ADP-ribose hydrolase 1-like n=1 Tax=Centroberyx affinis TaxID=166261 RepID=UPI003A5BA4F1
MAESFQSVWMALLLASITMMLLQPGLAKGLQGQAESIEKKVKEKCEKFVKNNPERVKISCDTFWKKFTSAFVKKDPDTIKQEDYKDLLEAEPIKIQKDELLLYSDTELLLPDNPETYVHIWQTIYGTLQGQNWCGKENSNEVFSKNCSTIPYNMYWAAVSTALAKKALGIVTVLLDGKKGYTPDSYLALYDVPNLPKKKVTGLRVLMVNEDGVNEDTCKHKSLKKLQEDIKTAMGSAVYQYECKSIQEDILQILSPEDWWENPYDD